MSGLLRIGLFISDLVFLNLAIILSAVIFNIPVGLDSVYLFIFSNLTWLFLIVVSNPYSYSGNWTFSKVFKNQASFVFMHLLVVASLIFFFRKNYDARLIGMIYILFVPLFFVWKSLILRYFNSFARNAELINIVIVGAGDMARDLRRYFYIHKEFNFRVLSLFEPRNGMLPLDEIQSFSKEKGVMEIYCCLPDVEGSEIKKLVEFGLGALIRVKLIADYRQFRQKSLQLEQFDQTPVINITTIPLDDWGNQLLKRVFDILFSLLVTLTILWWLVPIVAIAIKVDSTGPVFFRQRRNGINNKPFDCLKFRTMFVNDQANQKQATRDDARITRVGSLLRKTSLDEFPQFFNVLGGSMSIVGPRPHMIKHNEEYGKLIEKFIGRHYIRPGITGLAQSMGYRGETRNLIDMRNRVRLDRFYIENWSFIFDIRIIVLTITSLLTGSEKAY